MAIGSFLKLLFLFGFDGITSHRLGAITIERTEEDGVVVWLTGICASG